MTGRKKTEQEQKECKHKGRGGYREGSGRPIQAGNEDSKMYTFRAGGEVREFLDALECRTDFIKNCVRAAIKNSLTPASIPAFQQSSNSPQVPSSPEGQKPRRERASCGEPPIPRREGEELPKILGKVVAAENVKAVTMPMFDLRVACGFPVDLNNDEHAETENILDMVCPHPERCYMIRVMGESMKDVNIHSGDVIVVDRTQREPKESDIAVCELNGEYTVKHFVREGDHGWLVPENDDFPRIEVTADDRFNVWGVVQSVIHAL